jgi:ABC-type lipoprotein export system ATPase subunit
MAILRLHNLQKGYRSPDTTERRLVVDVPDFTPGQDTRVALSGPSGSGKTTLLNLIAGILRPDSGSISLDGVTMSALSEGKRDRLRAGTLGYVFQTFNLLQGYSALENVMLGMMFGPGTDTEFARHLLERVGLQDRMNYRPSQLSVGQQQRVAVARALANRPKLVLADEPTGNLDQRRSREAIELIQGMCAENKASLLLVSHDPNVLAQFQHVEDLVRINRAAYVDHLDDVAPDINPAAGAVR